MNSIPGRRYANHAKAAACTFTFALLSACATLPHVGPNKQQLFAGSVEREGDAYVVAVDDRVTQVTDVIPPLGFSQAFQAAGLVGSDTINAGDTLSLTIWENVDNGLMASAGVNATQLSVVQVDGDGFIFVPYAGRIRAAGNTPEAIRRIITEKLQQQTPDPQVEVRREAGDGATVTLVGSIAGQGVVPITRPTRKLSSMLAVGGGLTIEPSIAQVTVLRGGQRSKVWFEDIFADPANDIALRDGDRILVQEDSRAYTVLGAAGGQAVVRFASQDLSAIEALAHAGGLRSNAADPTGVFVLRDETPQISTSVLEQPGIVAPQRMIYVLNLTAPNGMFIARDFMIHDGDLIYVTEAPFAQWNKAISALTGSLASVGSISNLAP